MVATNFALLHGGAMGSWIWDETVAALKVGSGGAATCLVLDVPGCGVKRGRDTSAIDFGGIAAELNADIEAAAMHDVVLVGHSQAGNVMPRMVELAPKLFSRLVYVSCSAPPPGKTLLELMGDCRQGEHEDRVGWPMDPATMPLEERYAVYPAGGAGADSALGSRPQARLSRDAARQSWP